MDKMLGFIKVEIFVYQLIELELFKITLVPAIFELMADVADVFDWYFLYCDFIGYETVKSGIWGQSIIGICSFHLQEIQLNHVKEGTAESWNIQRW